MAFPLSLGRISLVLRGSEVLRRPARLLRSASRTGPRTDRALYSGGGLDQLKINLDLHHIAKCDNTDSGRQRDIDAEVLAADLGSGFEAGVTGPARKGFDSAKLNGYDNRTSDVTDGEITLDLILHPSSPHARG